MQDPSISGLDIAQYDIEDLVAPATPVWQRAVYNCDDASNYGRGLWRFRRVLAGTGPTSSFVKNGGKGVTATDVGE
jgi:hypothetical protein